MPPSPPHSGDLRIGDRVDVPGKMHGTVRFIGTVDNKKGTFVGVELSEQFASRGKNSGNVDGLSYFTTTIPGAGIFLPINRAIRRISAQIINENTSSQIPVTPINGGTKALSQGSTIYTPPTTCTSRFNQSVGNRRAPSPQSRDIRRPSMPRPESPLRKQYSLKPTIPSPNGKTPSKNGYTNLRKFGQSVRGTQDSRDSSKKIAGSPRNFTKSIQGSRSTSALGHSTYTQLDHRATPVYKTHNNTPNKNLESSLCDIVSVNNDENQRLRAQLEERDRQLKEQAISLAEMEKALSEVQYLIDSDTSSRVNRNSIEDKDVVQLRAILREKNEKISMLTTEFDAHRADFRSTIDTLEMASSETERVYEQRINELMQEINDLSSQSIDVNNVAKHLRQLEELVQELEEGLEEARRAEVEARGEVEFLRGEVERTRAELKREKGNANSNCSVTGCNTDGAIASKELEQRDDEIRGLKKIIHSLSRDSVQDIEDLSKPLIKIRSSTSDGMTSIEVPQDLKNMKRESSEIHQNMDVRANSADELQSEEKGLHRESLGAISAGTTATQGTSTVSNSQRKAVSPTDRVSHTAPSFKARSLIAETLLESDAYSSANESFCELCETAGHDILICTNVFTPGSKRPPRAMEKDSNLLVPLNNKSAYLSPMKTPRASSEQVIIKPLETEPIAGKESGVINMEKWCAICEREGHESIDCPFEGNL